MSWFNSTLSDVVRHKEEVKFAINHFALLDEALVNIGSSRRVSDLSVNFLKESLSYSFVHDDESDLREFNRSTALFDSVLISADFLKLVKLELNDVLTHGVAHSITVNENVVWHFTFVVISVSSE